MASDEPAKFLIAGLRPLDFVKRIAIILIGSAIFTFGVHNIHNVTGITEGGIIGLVLFGNHWFGIPPSIVSPALDCLSYAVALKVPGRWLLGWSAVATVAVAGFYRLWESLPPHVARPYEQSAARRCARRAVRGRGRGPGDSPGRLGRR
ncbi:MAG: YitT family protein [Collinsella sp.]